MSRWIVFAGLTAMLVTGYFATFHDRGQGPLRAVKFIPAELRTKVEVALKANDAQWAHVEMDGQKAILSGTAPSELDRDDALEIVRHAAGQGGTLWGGVTKVDGEAIRIAPPKKPYQWSAQLGDSQRVSLRGSVPSQRFKAQIAAAAKKQFPGGVVDLTQVASGQPTGDWLSTATHGLSYLHKLSTGEVQFIDSRITILGEAVDDRARQDIQTGFVTVKRPFEGVVNLSTPDNGGMAPPERPEDETPAAAADTVQRLPAADCQSLIDKAMRSNVIHFDLNASTISDAGKRKIDALAQTALQCPDLKLNVTGHADGATEPGTATDVARARAFAAAKLLTDKGVAADRLIVTGAGATQPDTGGDAADTGRNRRVEFSVIP